MSPVTAFRKYLAFAIQLFICSLNMSLAEKPAPSSELPKFPLGVYWPLWERVDIAGRIEGLNRWEYSDRLMAMLREYHVNLLWIVHMPPEDLQRFCDLAASHDLKVIVASGLASEIKDWSPENVDRAVERLVKEGRESKALVGYVGFDEPKGGEMQMMNVIGEAFTRKDPDRPFIIVARPNETPLAFHHIKNAILTIDSYEFYYDNVPWVDNLGVEGAQQRFINMTDMASRLAAKTRIPFWSMPQAFSETWTKRYYDPSLDKLVVGPGGYINWRMPTPAELEWQIWTAIGLGAKGIVPFVLLPGTNLTKAEFEEKKETLAVVPPHKWANVEAEPAHLDAATALIVRGLTPSRQLETLADCFKLLAPHGELLAECVVSYPIAWAQTPLNVFTLRHASSGKNYVVVVNNDVEKEQTGMVHFLPSTRQLISMQDGSHLPLNKQDDQNDLKVSLGAGKGLLIQVDSEPFAQELLWVVDFEAVQAGDQPLQKLSDLKWYATSDSKIPGYLALAPDKDSGNAEFFFHTKLTQIEAGKLYVNVQATRYDPYTKNKNANHVLPSPVEIQFFEGKAPTSEPIIQPAGAFTEIPATSNSVKVFLNDKNVHLERLRVIYAENVPPKCRRSPKMHHLRSLESAPLFGRKIGL